MGGLYGFHRIWQVRLRRQGAVVRAEVTGVLHRLPQTVAVPMRVAADLVLAGVPLMIDDGVGVR
jgi:hypothetical protein